MLSTPSTFGSDKMVPCCVEILRQSFAGRFCLHAAGLPLTSKASSHNLSYKCEAPRDPPCVARMFVMAILLQVQSPEDWKIVKDGRYMFFG